MKLIISTALASALATSAFAGNSDTYNDVRLNTAVGHVNVFADNPASSTKRDQTHKRTNKVTLSSRSAKRANTPNGYAYANPYGVGPHNDSR